LRNQDHLLKINRLQRVDSLWPVASRPLDGVVAFAPVRIWFGDVFIGAVGAVALLARRRSARRTCGLPRHLSVSNSRPC
jgi:hypothetical protein